MFVLLCISNYYNVGCSPSPRFASLYLSLQLELSPGNLELMHDDKDWLFYVYSCVACFSAALAERGKTKLPEANTRQYSAQQEAEVPKTVAVITYLGLPSHGIQHKAVYLHKVIAHLTCISTKLWSGCLALNKAL